MSSGPVPPELNQPLPRRFRINGRIKFLIAFITVQFLGIGVLLLAFVYNVSHDKAVLRESGVATAAQVNDLQVEHGKNESVYYRVSYQFRPPSMRDGQPGVQSGNGLVEEDRFRTLQIGQAVPILYDPARPANSGLNFDDTLHRSDPYAMMPLMMAIIGSLFGGVYIVLMAVMLFPYLKEKKLVQWGHVARAVIVREEEIGGGQATMTATYQFTDGQGRTITGIQKNLPSARKLHWPGFREFRQDVTENPIALYDPENSDRNMLYRAGSLVCYLPQR